MIRCVLSLCCHLIAFGCLMASGSLQAAQNSVKVVDLPGVSVKALVSTSDLSVLEPPGDGEPTWVKLEQPLGRGFGQQVYWVKFFIQVPEQSLGSPLVLRFHPPNARDVRFYLPDGQSLALGTEANAEQRLLGFPDLAAPFVARTNPTTVNVRLATLGRIFGTFEVMSERSYYQSQARRIALHGVLYGMLLLAFLVNVLSWVTTRQSIYGLYVSFVGFSLLASLAVNGYLHAWFFGAWPQYHATVQLWAFAGMAATAIAFATRLLRLGDWHVRVEKAADLLAVSLMVLVVVAAIWVSMRPYVWELLLAAFVVYGLSSLAASARNWWTSPSVQNTLVALAFVVFVVSQWISMGTVFGLLPATAVNVGMWQVGLVLHLVLLQMALVINSRKRRWDNWQQQARLDTLKLQADVEARRSRDLQLFLERLTHEFKTPLAVIDSSVQSLAMLEQAHEPQRDLRYDRIRRAVTRLNDLLMRSLVAEKNTLVSGPSRREILSLPTLLEAALSELGPGEMDCSRDCVINLDQPQLGDGHSKRRLVLSWDSIQHPESLLIDADVGWLQAALYHVFDNAIKYSVGDEPIQLKIGLSNPAQTSPVVEISTMNWCDETVIEEDLPRFFEKYFRKGEHGNVPGAGIGLYVAKQSIAAHGGTLAANLHQKGQIVFRIRLPLVTHKTR